jgi:hypothetical protein
MGLLINMPLWVLRLHARGTGRRARGRARAVAGGRDGGPLARAVPGVTRARPPAVAVIGLRRSGRTGNDESPCGRVAPACQPGPLGSYPIPVTAVRPGLSRRQAHGALCAPLKTYGKSSRVWDVSDASDESNGCRRSAAAPVPSEV